MLRRMRDQTLSVEAPVAGMPAPQLLLDVKAFLADPYPGYARLRREKPVALFKRPLTGDTYFVTRYDDVLAVLRDNDRFAQERSTAGVRETWLQAKLTLGLRNTMLMRDDPHHRRLRGLVHKAFTPARVEALAARVGELVGRLLDRVAARGRAELIADLALPLPITVICEMMGVPEPDRVTFRRLVNGLVDVEGQGLLGLLSTVPKVAWLFRYLRGLIERRRARRGEDLLSAMIAAEEDGERLSSDELVSSTFLLLFAGHETTVNLIGNGVLALLDHPDQLERLRDDPSLIDLAVEELLRFTNPVQVPAPRFARMDLQLSGVSIPRGAAVVAAIASANRDETRFTHPDALDITRSPNKHVAFGFGAHYCIGAPLARLEAKAAFLALLDRFPRMRLGVPRDQVRWRRSMSLRGLQALPLELG